MTLIRSVFWLRATAGVLSLLLPFSVSASSPRPGADVPIVTGALPPGVTLTRWATGLQHPWGLALLPDGGALVTERPGRLRVVGADGALSDPVEGVPGVDARGQGGLLDVALDPAFKQNRRIYLSYAERAGTGNRTAVARAVLASAASGWRLEDVQVIFRQHPAHDGTLHFGSRLVFAADGRLFVTLGERSQRAEEAQSPGNTLGKVVRIEADGKVPADNPFAGRAGVAPEIWSLGHRNPQGAALHPESGELWLVEHGPQGGDELNRVRAGANYGWPLYTYGERYGGGRIGEPASPPGFEAPLHAWVPSVSPSGLAFYTSNRIPAWQGSLFTGALSGRALVRLSLKQGTIVEEERLLADRGWRIRHVVAAPDGALLLLTDARDGAILRVAPPAARTP